jgi:hypothetical protein
MTEVNLDFNVGGNYSSSLTQMIAQAEQYARVNDTLVGKLNVVNLAMIGLIDKTSKITGVYKTSVAEAAAYEQAMSGLAATAVAAGKSFDGVQKATLNLAREVPGGIGEAVKMVTALQQSGVTATTSIGKLGKAFSDLGAANGFDGAAIGKQLLEMNRSFGNSEQQLGKFGDSLTTLSAKYGASAASSLSFAKALAPVASSVGITETAVIGLGTAASRLGEDGAASYNAFNKVLLDMSSSIRNGTPQLREYAGLLGMNQQALSDLFKSDPTEVLVRFTEAIGKGGPDAQRALEALGLDAVRTQKALTALSSQGDLRSIIGDSTKAYGDGSTEKAAAAAINNVNTQMQMLQESMSQAVASAGRPFLSFLGSVVGAANQAAAAVASVMQGPIGQAVGTVTGPVAGVAEGAGGMGMALVSNMAMLAMGRRAFNFGRAKTQGFGIGRDMARGGMTAEEVAMARTGMTPAELAADTSGKNVVLKQAVANEASGMPMGPMITAGGKYGSTVPGFVPSAGQMRAGFGATLKAATNLTAAGFNWQSNDFRTADWRTQVKADGTPYTQEELMRRSAAGKEYQETRTAIRAARQGAYGVFAPGTAGSNVAEAQAAGGNIAGITTASRESANAIGKLAKETATLEKPMVNLRSSVIGLGQTMAMYAKREAAAGLGAVKGVGGGLMATAGPLIAIAGAMAAIEFTLSKRSENEQKMAKFESGFKDANAQYNDFASAAGLASKGLVSLSVSTADMTKKMQDAATATSNFVGGVGGDVAVATSPGYNAAFKASDPYNTQRSIAEAQGVLGVDASPAAIERMRMDYANSVQGDAKKIQEFTSGINKKSSGYEDLMGAYVEARGFAPWSEPDSIMGNGMTDAQAGIGQSMASRATQNVKSVGSIYGESSDAAIASKFVEASKILSATNTEKQKDSWWNGLPTEQANFAARTSIGDVLGLSDDQKGILKQGLEDNKTLDEIIPTIGGGVADQYKALKSQGFDFNNPDFAKLAQTPEAQSKAEELDKTFAKLVPGAKDLSTALYAAAKAAAAAGKDMGKLSDAEVKRQGGLVGLAAYRLQQNPNAANSANLSGLLLQDAIKGTGSARGAVTQGYQMLEGLTESKNPLARQAVKAMIQQAQVADIVPSAARSTGQNQRLAIEQGQRARELLKTTTDPEARQGLMQQIQGEQEAYAQRIQMMKQFVMQKLQLDRQLARAERDSAITQARALRDLATQETEARKDYKTQRDNADYDHKLQMDRADKDHTLQVENAKRDERRREQDATDDFHLQQQRSQRDFNKQMARMVEDSAKSLYDPYKRIQAQQVWDAGSLLNNLKQQNEAILKQTAQLAQLQAMGVSQAVISQLDLSNPNNAQQLNRLVNDLANDPSLVGRYNATAAQRSTATSGLVENNANDTYRRSVEDYNTAQHDATLDFEKSIKRTQRDFAISLADNEKEYRKSVSRSETDYKTALARQDAELEKSIKRARAHLKTSFGDMTADLKKARQDAYIELSHFGEEIGTGPDGVVGLFNKAVTGLGSEIAKMPKNIRPSMSTALKDLTTHMAADLKTYGAAAFAPFGIDFVALINGAVSAPHGATSVPAERGAPEGTTTPTPAGQEGRPGWANAAGTGGRPPGRSSTGGYVMGPGTELSDSIPMMLSRGEYVLKASAVKNMPPGLLEALNNGMPLHMNGLEKITNADRGTIYHGSGSSQAEADRRRMADMQTAADRKAQEDAANAKAKAAEAAKTSPHTAHLAHMAHMAHMQHEVHMSRVNSHTDQIRAARTMPYSSSTTHHNMHHYDSRTQVMGPITVKADDPAKMLEALKKKVAMSRLVSPSRAAIPTSV